MSTTLDLHATLPGTPSPSPGQWTPGPCDAGPHSFPRALTLLRRAVFTPCSSCAISSPVPVHKGTLILVSAEEDC